LKGLWLWIFDNPNHPGYSSPSARSVDRSPRQEKIWSTQVSPDASLPLVVCNNGDLVVCIMLRVPSYGTRWPARYSGIPSSADKHVKIEAPPQLTELAPSPLFT
jgi:hypothetical protein